MRWAAAAIRSALSRSSSPSSALTRAAAPLMRPSQRATGTGIGSPENGKLTTAFVVSPPQSSGRSSIFAIEARVRQDAGRPQQELGHPTEPELDPLALTPRAALPLSH